MRLSLRFICLVAALVLGVAASTISGWYALSHLDSALEAGVSLDVERLLAITHARRLFDSMTVLERDLLLSSSPDERRSVEGTLVTAAQQLIEHVERCAALMPTEDAETVESIRAARDRWMKRHDQIGEAMRQGRPEAIQLSSLHEQDAAWETAIGALIRSHERRLTLRFENAHGTAARARRTLLLVSLWTALVGATFGYVVLAGIRKTAGEVEIFSAGLERLVKTRTEELTTRERSLRLLMDSTGDGIIGVTTKGTIAGEISAAAARWFGKARAGQTVAQYLFPEDSDEETAFQVALEQLLEGHLPWDVLAAQMPSSLAREDTILELDYKRVVGGQGDVALLIVARDVTERVLSERAESEAREQQSLVAKLLSNKQAFAEFVRETERQLLALESERDAGSARKNLRTLKAKAAMYGLGSVARLCEEIENRVPDSAGTPAPSDVAELATLFSTKLRGIEDFLTGLTHSRDHETDSSEQRALIDGLLTRRDRRELLDMVELWTWPRTSERLGRLRVQVEYAAKRLRKQVRVEVEHNDLRLPTDYLTRFWATLTHVVRNCVDHGIETVPERVAQGKPPTGVIRLRTWQTDENFCLEVADDGAGIDTDALLRSATARGVDVEQKNALELVLVDGVSARTKVSDLSGLGVGLSAIREACASEGGQIELWTEPGKGASFVFRFPRPVIRTGKLAARVERRWTPLHEQATGSGAWHTSIRSPAFKAG